MARDPETVKRLYEELDRLVDDLMLEELRDLLKRTRAELQQP